MEKVLSIEELIHSKKSVLIGLKNRLETIPNRKVSQAEKDDEIINTNKEISEAKAELIQLYKNLITDCETELELLQPDYSKKPEYIILKSTLEVVKKNQHNYAWKWAYQADLNRAEKELADYELKHNIKNEN